MDEKSQAVDLWAVWGVVLVKVLAAQAGYALGVAFAGTLAFLVKGTAIAISVTVGVGLVFAVVVAYAVGIALDKYKVKENFITLLRSLETPQRDDADSLALQSLYMGGT